ncbi:MAG: hypothetical protein HRU80_02630 [Ignavibacteriales bacterium]|nr:MAG: hypothetical protein HRU80_02630 [Ignavibacteriales bacterium]
MQQTNELEYLRSENERLKNEIRSKEQNLNNLLKEKEFEVKKAVSVSQNSILQDKQIAVNTETWTEAMDELAHAINTSIMVATSAIKELPESPERSKAFTHIRQIKNYTELVLWDLHIRKGEFLNSNAEPVEIDLVPIFTENITAIKDEPSVLRPRNKNRAAQYSEMKVATDFPQKCLVMIPSELKNVFDLLFLELLKNSFINTNAENPHVRVHVKELPRSFEVLFENNKIMDEKYRNWFMGKSADSSFDIAKSIKVGLRLVMRWTEILKVSRDVTIVTEEELTRITLTIPKVIQL